MKVCDVCGKPAHDNIKIERQSQNFDVCEEHLQKFLETLQKISDPPKRGRPPKNSE